LVSSGTTVPYPPLTQNFHFEIELVVAVGAAATNVSEAKANGVIYGYAVGIYSTRRDLQQDA
jgi:fumarylpyruvate hydrolase